MRFDYAEHSDLVAYAEASAPIIGSTAMRPAPKRAPRPLSWLGRLMYALMHR